MARNKLTAKVKGSSILEVIVSMVVIVVVFGIAMIIFSNVMRYSTTEKELMAKALLQEALIKEENRTADTLQSATISGFRIEKEVRGYPGGLSLTEIILTAYDQNHQKVAVSQKIIKIDNE